MGAKHFNVTQDKDGTYVLSGELTIHDLDYLKEFLESSVARTQALSLSFEELSFADTACLQFLVAFRKSLSREAFWEVKGCSAEMERVLSVSGMGALLL